jgi:hypothetical protein
MYILLRLEIYLHQPHKISTLIRLRIVHFLSKYPETEHPTAHNNLSSLTSTSSITFPRFTTLRKSSPSKPPLLLLAGFSWPLLLRPTSTSEWTPTATVSLPRQVHVEIE